MGVPINPHPELKGKLLPHPEVIEAQLIDTEIELKRLRLLVYELEQKIMSNGWTSRLDSLPEPDQRVVFAGIKQSGDGQGARYLAIGSMSSCGTWIGPGWTVKHDRVSHWMPIDLPHLSERDKEYLYWASERDGM